MYSYIEPDFIEKYALTNDEVDEAIKNGILADGYDRIFLGKIKENLLGSNHVDEEMPRRAKELGAKFMIDCGCTDIFKTEHLGSTCMFLTSYFLIWVCTPNWNINLKSGINTYLKPETPVIVMPLSVLKNIYFESKEMGGAWKPVIKEKAGNPVKGAVMGGILAGATGAVIGAAVSSKPKNETVIRGGSFHCKYYIAKVEIAEKSRIEAEIFNIDTVTKAISDEHRWTYLMNEILLGKHDTSSLLDGTIIEDYSEILDEIMDGCVDYKKRQKCVHIIEQEIKQKLEIPTYCSNETFFFKLYDSIANRNSPSIIIQKIISELEPYYEEENRREKIQKEILELKQKKNQLGMFKSKDKQRIEDEISSLERTINENGEYSLLKKYIVNLSFLDDLLETENQQKDKEIFKAENALENKELSEDEISILELLQDGKKRTISEMQKDSNVLAKVSNQRLAGMALKLTESGILEKNVFNQKLYFSITDK